MDSVIQNFTDWLKGIIKETLNKLLKIKFKASGQGLEKRKTWIYLLSALA